MKRTVCILSTLAAVCCAPAFASVITFNVMVNGAQAGTDSPGTGTAMVTVDDVENSVMVDLTFSGLLAPTTNAHIHCCAPPGHNAGVVLPFVPAGFPLGVTSGTFQNTFLDVDPAVIADLQSFQSYVNIHTELFPGGEIRGNLVPEPATTALLGIGLMGLAFWTRRHTRI